jgi:predicted thioesterase
MPLAPGLSAEVELRVSPADTAAALGSGDVPALGTPRVLALCEEASVRALAGRLAPGQTSVGTRVELAHLAASPTGATVRARATLEAVEGRLLRFRIELRDGERTLAEGSLSRALVDRERFLAKLR